MKKANGKSNNATSANRKPIHEKRSKQIWRQFKKNKGAVIGLVVFTLIVIIAIVSSFAFDYNGQIIKMNSSQRLLAPSLQHPFGTDQMGRDVMMRIFYGARYSLIIAFSSISISILVGTSLGCIAGFFGGKIENLIMRVMDILLLIPNLLITIIFVAIFGVSFMNLIIALGVATIAPFARTARAAVMTVRTNEYVEASQAIGSSSMRTLLRHVFPNSFSAILVQATTRMGMVIIQAAGFSFLGLGVPAPTPEWGAMLSDARSFMREFPYLTFWPGMFIFITVLAINLIGDGLRDALDPKLKR